MFFAYKTFFMADIFSYNSNNNSFFTDLAVDSKQTKLDIFVTTTLVPVSNIREREKPFALLFGGPAFMFR